MKYVFQWKRLLKGHRKGLLCASSAILIASTSSTSNASGMGIPNQLKDPTGFIIEGIKELKGQYTFVDLNMKTSIPGLFSQSQTEEEEGETSPSQSSVPELALTGIFGAATFIFGGIAVLFGRRRKED